MKTKEIIETMYKTRDFLNLSELFINDEKLLEELVSIATSDLSHPYPEYASWLLVHISQKEPQIIEIYQSNFIDTILISSNQSVLRNLINTSHRLPLIEHKESEYLNKLIDFISDDSNKVALFVYSIYKLIQFTQKYPDLKIEIESIISLKEISTMKPAMRIGIRNYLAKTAN